MCIRTRFTDVLMVSLTLGFQFMTKQYGRLFSAVKTKNISIIESILLIMGDFM